jgi:hypothetical protein
MKKTETIELIKGIFTPDDAREILLTLLDNKINFHDLRSWSSQERFGMPDPYSEERLTSLRESREKVKQIISQSIDQEKNLIINSSIEITIT